MASEKNTQKIPINNILWYLIFLHGIKSMILGIVDSCFKPYSRHHEGSTTNPASLSQLIFVELAAQMAQFLKIQNPTSTLTYEAFAT